MTIIYTVSNYRTPEVYWRGTSFKAAVKAWHRWNQRLSHIGQRATLSQKES